MKQEVQKLLPAWSTGKVPNSHLTVYYCEYLTIIIINTFLIHNISVFRLFYHFLKCMYFFHMNTPQ